jgi:hypothetical protein
MGSLSDYSELELLDHVFNAAYSPAATVYLALCTADPTDAGTGASMNECADSGSYARKAITFGAANARSIAQSGTVTFDAATGSWGTASHWAIVDSGTHGAGNMLAHGSLSESKSIVSGNTPSVASGQVTVSFSAGEISTYLANKLLDLMFRNQAYSKPATHVALAVSALADADTDITAKECSGTSYARVQVNINGGSSPTWDLAASGALDNTHAITFPAAGGSWSTIVGVGICDAASGGNLLFYDNAMADQAVGTGDTVSFAIGALDVEMS